MDYDNHRNIQLVPATPTSLIVDLVRSLAAKGQHCTSMLCHSYFSSLVLHCVAE